MHAFQQGASDTPSADRLPCALPRKHIAATSTLNAWRTAKQIAIYGVQKPPGVTGTPPHTPRPFPVTGPCPALAACCREGGQGSCRRGEDSSGRGKGVRREGRGDSARWFDEHVPSGGVPEICAAGVREVSMLGHRPGGLGASESAHFGWGGASATSSARCE